MPTPRRKIDGIEALRGLSGDQLGVSSWLRIDQSMVDQFAQVTGDHQWIHVDPERPRRESPFGTTIAHGCCCRWRRRSAMRSSPSAG
jgi:acyl dehydratase